MCTHINIAAWDRHLARCKTTGLRHTIFGFFVVADPCCARVGVHLATLRFPALPRFELQLMLHMVHVRFYAQAQELEECFPEDRILRAATERLRATVEVLKPYVFPMLSSLNDRVREAVMTQADNMYEFLSVVASAPDTKHGCRIVCVDKDGACHETLSRGGVLLVELAASLPSNNAPM